MNLDPVKLSDATPDQLETLLGLMSQLETLEGEKIKTLRELRKAISLLTLWPNLWTDHAHHKVSTHWRDLSEGQFRRNKKFIFVITVRGGKVTDLVEQREFSDVDVPEVFERPEGHPARRSA